MTPSVLQLFTDRLLTNWLLWWLDIWNTDLTTCGSLPVTQAQHPTLQATLAQKSPVFAGTIMYRLQPVVHCLTDACCTYTARLLSNLRNRQRYPSRLLFVPPVALTLLVASPRGNIIFMAARTFSDLSNRRNRTNVTVLFLSDPNQAHLTRRESLTYHSAKRAKKRHNFQEQ